jgi:hypothetical protein
MFPDGIRKDNPSAWLFKENELKQKREERDVSPMADRLNLETDTPPEPITSSGGESGNLDYLLVAPLVAVSSIF